MKKKAKVFKKAEVLRAFSKKMKRPKKVSWVSDNKVWCATARKMVDERRVSPCKNEKCEICRLREKIYLESEEENLAWEERRQRREIKGFYFGIYESEEKLKAKEGAKEGMYAFVENGQDEMVQYVYNKEEWKKIITK